MLYSDKIQELKAMHRFRAQLGKEGEFFSNLSRGTLRMDLFRDFAIQYYFLQKSLVKFLALISAKNSPDIETLKLLGDLIADPAVDLWFSEISHELKIKPEELTPNPVTVAMSQWLVALGYGSNLKDCLVVLVSFTPTLAVAPSSNPLFNEWKELYDQNLVELVTWARDALNRIRKEDHVNHKHQALVETSVDFQLSFFIVEHKSW